MSTYCPVCLKDFHDTCQTSGRRRLAQHQENTGHTSKVHGSTRAYAQCPFCHKTFQDGYYHTAEFKLSMHLASKGRFH